MAETILGPIDYLAVEWPGRHVTGEGFRLLMDLVDREIVRVLDVLFIAKDADGNVAKVDVADVEHSDAAVQAGPPAAIPAAAALASPDMGDKLAQLKQLGDLRASGVLTDAEFEVQKSNILSA